MLATKSANRGEMGVVSAVSAMNWTLRLQAANLRLDVIPL
jgi:hypothetical protein